MGRAEHRRRWPWIVLAAVVVLMSTGTVVAWQQGWLERSFWAARGECGATTWTSPKPLPPAEPAVELETVPGPGIAVTDLAFHPTLDVGYVIGRSGELHQMRDGRISDEVMAIEVSVEHDQGLLGGAVDPDGEWLYLNYTDPEGTSHVVAHALGPDGELDPDARPLLELDQDTVHHNGGAVAFGPDGLLYLTFGDGGEAGDRWDNGQRRATLLGGLVRIDPSPADDPPYRVPEANPWATAERGAENVAIGLRNPYRISFDEPTGTLWIADVGNNCYEELNRIAVEDLAAANFGWNRFEGVHAFVGGEPELYVPPVLAYPHRGPQCAVIGGHVYRGERLPGLRGHYVFGDFCTGELLALAPDASLTHFGVEAPGLLGIGRDRAGELYALSGEGVHRIVPAG